MKKIICLILAMLFLLTAVVGCGTDATQSEDSTNVAEESTLESTETTQKAEKGPYTGEFKVGYSRVDITPKGDIELNNYIMMTHVLDPLYATCIAFNDGDETVLVYTLDLKSMGKSTCDTMRTRINKLTKVPKKNIYFSVTHNHSAPVPGINRKNNATWTAQLTTALSNAAKEAIADLSDAKIMAGTAKTPGMAFVRRYIHEDGTFSGIWYRGASETPIVKHETEVDDTLQVVRFVREDKKDVVITNWQAHAADAIGYHKNSLTSDFVYFLRYITEKKDDDLLLAFFAGASGNVNLSAKVEGTQKYANYQQVGQALAQLILKTLDNLEPLEAGTIQNKFSNYTAEYRKGDSEETIANANIVKAIKDTESEEYEKALDQYGFMSKHEVDSIISRNSRKEDTNNIDIGTFGMGDLAFVTVPYEMFDTNGMEVKEGSPYKMTFILTNAGGADAYVPSKIAVPNGGYEVYTSIYKYGTAEEVVAFILENLNAIYEKG